MLGFIRWDWTTAMILLLVLLGAAWITGRDDKGGPATIPGGGEAAGDVLYSAAAPQAETAPADAEPQAGDGTDTQSPTDAQPQAAEQTAVAPAAEAPAPAKPLAPPSAPLPQVRATSFAIVERGCGTLLAGKGEHERAPPASLTKIITALVVMDRVPLTDEVVSDVSATKMKGSSVMGLEPGMRLTVNDLLFGLILRSGNDAALVLAKHTSGSVAAFVEAMNAKAQALGLTDTHFTNPHGLDSPLLYSSPFDMAAAGRVLLDNPVLAKMSSTLEYQPAWDKPTIRNGNKLLNNYAGAYGVKNGYTENAHQTMVAAAQRGGRDIIVSLFGSANRYDDAKLLLDWAFASTQPAC